jgi:hypothetical protein
LCNNSLVILIYEKQDKTGYYNQYEFLKLVFFSLEYNRPEIKKRLSQKISSK